MPEVAPMMMIFLADAMLNGDLYMQIYDFFRTKILSSWRC